MPVLSSERKDSKSESDTLNTLVSHTLSSNNSTNPGLLRKPAEFTPVNDLLLEPWRPTGAPLVSASAWRCLITHLPSTGSC